MRRTLIPPLPLPVFFQIRPGGKATFDADALAIRTQMKESRNGGAAGLPEGAEGAVAAASTHPNAKNWGRYDSSALHIQHALKQTEVQRKYSKPYSQPIESYLVRIKTTKKPRLWPGFLAQNRPKSEKGHFWQKTASEKNAILRRI